MDSPITPVSVMVAVNGIVNAWREKTINASTALAKIERAYLELQRQEWKDVHNGF